MKTKPGELNKDDVIIDLLEKFKCDIFIVIIDVLVSKLKSDFKETRNIVKDMVTYNSFLVDFLQ